MSIATNIVFTQAAAEKVQSLIEEEGDPSLCLRVFVQGGGCSGFQYGFTFDTDIRETDTVITQTVGEHNTEVKLLVDAMSFQYLAGAEIDYQENVQGAQFVIRNPNASTTCGCGASFSAEPKES